ncbi:MAG: hypothetical protein N3B01_03970 [Verrucomicrobiae bacterium]|nr:hypothetical protein [Verrucomicrobiae bacterium]
MEWLKKYYDKVLLAAALLLLIVVAAVLLYKINDIATGLELPVPGDKQLAAADLYPYSNAMADIKSPPYWINPNPAALFPPVAVTVVTNIPEKGPPFVVDGVVRRPFVLQFKTYIWDSQTQQPRNFQINFITVNRSFFIEKVGMEIADRHGKTGYVIQKFERKTRRVQVPGIKGEREEDVSELTIKHEGEEPITLVNGVITPYPRRYARIRIEGRAAPLELPGGESFQVDKKTYKIIDINDKEVVIEEQTKLRRKHVFPATPLTL